ncbi:hypothetical protein N7931_13325 [Catenovulum sp. 2E275]|uniref:hypothetical protein n=1 Tax=Catenovulum sp. 2E275 TaxID=2980497 RepID=UPI0021CEFF1F|nr:hypothetical protein [Catenovulum sp. 2E275]MCU4676613.1 hypothetical protein [Catenovulum sp. 2E275]
MRKTKAFLFILLLSLNISQGQSAELKFTRTDNQFSYQWQDHNQNTQTLSFKIDKKPLFNLFRKFKAYRPALAQNYLYKQLQAKVPNYQSRYAQIQVKKQGLGVELTVKAQDKAELIKLNAQMLELRTEILNQYLDKHYYMEFTNRFAQAFIKPDHIRIAQESLPLFDDIVAQAQENLKNMSGRDIINYYLSWVQSIPYSTLEDRSQSQGLGFSPPNKLLLENQGDCDSKSTLFISLMRAFFSHLNIVMVYLPNHALVGLQLGHISQDEYISLDGIDYVLAEPTGPGLFKVGEISEQSKQDIMAGRFTVEELPTSH